MGQVRVPRWVPRFADEASGDSDKPFPDLEASYLSHGSCLTGNRNNFKQKKKEEELGFKRVWLERKRSLGKGPWIGDGHGKARESKANFRERRWYIRHPYSSLQLSISFETKFT